VAVDPPHLPGPRRGRVAGIRSHGDAFRGEHGDLRSVRAVRVEARREHGVRTFVPTFDAEVQLDADLVLIAIGYQGATRSALLDELSVTFDAGGNIGVDEGSRALTGLSSRPGTRFEVRR